MLKRDKKKIREFLKQYDVKVHFVKRSYSLAYGGLDLIEIGTETYPTDSKLWSMVFHELAHVVCYREGLYKEYHHENRSNKKYAIYIRRYGLRAERFVDKMAKKMMKKHFPKMKFEDSYLTEHEIEWYYKWVDKNYPL